jgi:hypothetical protein
MPNVTQAKTLSIIDQLEIAEDGTITGWACVLNALSLTQETIGECPAHPPETGGPGDTVRANCPRGFTERFQCRKLGVDD